jgi:TP901 family phage tail tape measure protein
MATVGSLVVRIGADVSGLDKALQTAQGRLRQAGAQMKQIGTGLTLGISAPIAGIATVALNSASDFEASMNLMQATTGATADQMAALEAQALNLGATTAFSAGEAAQAQLELAKAGMSVTDTMSSLPGVLDLAAAGGLDLALAAEIAANTINSFNLPASEAASVANTLAAAANASSVDVTDMADALKMVGTVAAQNNVSLQDTSTALAILGNNAIKGSDAGTSLKTMLMRLTAPTKDAAGVMAEFGIEVYDSQGAILPFTTILGNLNTAFEGTDDATRNAAMSTLFGADAIRAASVLIDNSGASWDAMSEAVNKSGAASNLADARMKGLGGAIEYFKGTLDSVLIGSASPFLDTLNSMIRTGADLLGQITTLPPEMQMFGAALLGVAAVAGPLLLTFGAMSTALAGLLSPIGLIAGAAILLGVAWATNFGGIQDITANAVGAMAPLFAQLQQWLGVALPAALAFVQPALNGLQQSFAGLPAKLGPLATSFAGFGTAVQQLWTTIQPFVTYMATAFVAGLGVVAVGGINLFTSALDRIVPIATTMVAQLTLSVQTITTIVTEMVGLVAALIDGDWAGAWSRAQSIGQAVFDYLSGTSKNFATVIDEVFGLVYDAVVGTLDDLNTESNAILNSIKRWWDSTWRSMTRAIEPVVSAVEGFKKTLSDFKSWVTGLSIPNPFAGWQMPAMPSIPGWPGGGDQANNAVGTPRWPGGATWVGERGPELVWLPGGSRITPAAESAAMTRGEQISIGPVTINNGMDVEELAYKIFAIRNRRQ